MFHIAKKGTVEYLESEALSALGFVTHAFCTRNGGVSAGPYTSLNVGDLVGDREEDVLRNISLVEKALEYRKGG